MKRFFSNDEPEEAPEEELEKEESEEEESEEESEPQQRYTEEREVRMIQPYEFTFHYKNGDVETKKTYSKKITKEDHDNKIYFKYNPQGKYTDYHGLHVSYDQFTRNYNTLAREPTMKTLDEEKWVFEYKSVNGNIIPRSINFFREQKICDVDGE